MAELVKALKKRQEASTQAATARELASDLGHANTALVLELLRQAEAGGLVAADADDLIRRYRLTDAGRAAAEAGA